MLTQAAGWAARGLSVTASTATEAAQDNPIGSGSHLPLPVLVAATISAGLSTILSIATVWLQLKHYHKPRLQRLVVRILVMCVARFPLPPPPRVPVGSLRSVETGFRSTPSRLSSRCTR